MLSGILPISGANATFPGPSFPFQHPLAFPPTIEALLGRSFGSCSQLAPESPRKVTITVHDLHETKSLTVDLAPQYIAPYAFGPEVPLGFVADSVFIYLNQIPNQYVRSEDFLEALKGQAQWNSIFENPVCSVKIFRTIAKELTIIGRGTPILSGYMITSRLTLSPIPANRSIGQESYTLAFDDSGKWSMEGLAKFANVFEGKSIEIAGNPEWVDGNLWIRNGSVTSQYLNDPSTKTTLPLNSNCYYSLHNNNLEAGIWESHSTSVQVELDVLLNQALKEAGFSATIVKEPPSSSSRSADTYMVSGLSHDTILKFHQILNSKGYSAQLFVDGDYDGLKATITRISTPFAI